MLDKVLILFAKKNDLLTTDRYVFGEYEGLLLSLSVDLNNVYTLVVRVELNDNQIQLLNQKKIRKEFSKSINAQRIDIDKNTMIFSNIRIGLLTKKKLNKIEDGLTNLRSLMGKYKILFPLKDSDISLFQILPIYKNESLALEVKNNFRTFKNHEIDYFNASITSAIMGAVSGVIFSLISMILQQRLKYTLSPILVGLLLLGICSRFYQKVSIRIDNFSKLYITFASMASIFIFKISLTALNMRYTNNELSSEEIVRGAFHEALSIDQPIFIGAYIFTAVYSLLVLQANKIKHEDNFFRGKKISNDEFDKHLLIADGNIFISITLGVGFFLLLITSYLHVTTTEDSHYLYIELVFFLGAIVYLLTWWSFEYIKKQSKKISLGLQFIGHKKINKYISSIINHLFILVFSISATLTLLIINKKFDPYGNLVLKVQALEDYQVNQGYCQSLSFLVENFRKQKLRVCKSEYRFLPNKIVGKIDVKAGLLRIPYGINLKFDHLLEFDKFIKKINYPQDLTYNQIIQFYLKDQSQGFKTRIDSWKSSCSSKPYKCRHYAYIMFYDDKLAEGISYLKKGCEFNDFYSCYSLANNFLDDIAQSDRSQAAIDLSKGCIDNNGEACYYLAQLNLVHHFIISSVNDQPNELLTKSCDLGFKFSCDEIKN